MEYDRDTDTHTLVRKVFTLQDMTVPFDTPSVESFVLGKVQDEEVAREMISTNSNESYEGDY